MPFLEEFDSVYEDLICPALEDAGYQVTRADEISNQQAVMKDVVTSIAESDLIVADLTSNNPNVFYELGVAHGLRRDVILMTQEIESLPFDLRSYRVVEYSLVLRDAKRASGHLLALATGALSGETQFGNPLSDFVDPVDQEAVSRRVDSDGPLGIIDFQEQFEECTSAITSAIEKVGSRTETYGGVLREGTSALEDLKGRTDRPTPKQVRAALSEVTEETNQYAAELSEHNQTYEELLPLLESSLDGLIHSQPIDTPEQMAEFRDALDQIDDTVSGFQQGIDGAQSMKDAIDSMPSIERQLNSANKRLSNELHRFITNISRTHAIALRATEIGRVRTAG